MSTYYSAASSITSSLFSARTHFFVLIVLLSSATFTWPVAQAGTWLSFNQKSRGDDGELMPQDRFLHVHPKNQNAAPAGQMRNAEINPEMMNAVDANSGNIINLLELCNERSKRKQLSQRTATNELCRTLLRAVDYELQSRRK